MKIRYKIRDWGLDNIDFVLSWLCILAELYQNVDFIKVDFINRDLIYVLKSGEILFS